VKEDNQEVKQVLGREHFAQDEVHFYFDGFVRLGRNARGWTDSRSGRDSDDDVADSVSETVDAHLDRVETRFDIDPHLSVE